MEEDAVQVLKFMASNGLIVNPNKTAMLFLNHDPTDQFTLNIGNVDVNRVCQAKLLGMTFNEKQNWNDHIYAKGGPIGSLNQRIFLIRRLKQIINKDALIKNADSLFISKVLP